MTSNFITFEGCEGCGKTTQARIAYEALQQRNISVYLTREPGGTTIGDDIRKILLHPSHTHIDPLTELLLYEACRAQHARDVIWHNLCNDTVVLCDRYCDSTIAYQGYGRQLDLETIEQLNAMASYRIFPILTFLFDIDVETGLKRALSRTMLATTANETRFEQETLEFHQRVRRGFLAIAQQHTERFCVIDANDTIDAIHTQVMQQLVTRGII